MRTAWGSAQRGRAAATHMHKHRHGAQCSNDCAFPLRCGKGRPVHNPSTGEEAKATDSLLQARRSMEKPVLLRLADVSYQLTICPPSPQSCRCMHVTTNHPLPTTAFALDSFVSWCGTPVPLQ